MSRGSQIVVIVIVVVALVALALSLFLLVDQTEKAKAEVARQEAVAREVKHINAQSVRSLDIDVVDPFQDDNYISFNFYTTPPGAMVYQNGMYLGTTPIEQKKLPKSVDGEDVRLVIVLDGHRIERRVVQLSDNFSDAITLQKLTVASAAGGAKQEDGADTVYTNRAVVMPLADDVPVMANKPVIANKPATANKNAKPKTGSSGKSGKSGKSNTGGSDFIDLPD